MSQWRVTIGIKWNVLDFFPATVSDTLTVGVQVEAFLASPVFAVLVLALLGHLVLPVIFVFDFIAGTALERNVRIWLCYKGGWAEGEGDEEGRSGKLGAYFVALPVRDFYHDERRLGGCLLLRGVNCTRDFVIRVDNFRVFLEFFLEVFKLRLIVLVLKEKSDS